MMCLYTRGAMSLLRTVSKANRWSSSSSAAESVVVTISSASTSPAKTFHKRQLPEALTSMSSAAGKKLFREALALRGMESFFPLSEQFVTQSEPSFCALSTLAMVLNALNHDPGKAWKGPWRWISEETLQCETRNICGHSLEKVKRNGMDFGEFESLAQCHGVRIRSFRSGPPAGTGEVGTSSSSGVSSGSSTGSSVEGIDDFRRVVAASAASAAADSFVVVNFSRRALGQTGDGHFSPVGGYHPTKDLVLILDVARFKYPPYWVSLAALWESMGWRDEITGKSRGYFVISGGGGGGSAVGGVLPEGVVEGAEGAEGAAQRIVMPGQHVHSSACSHGISSASKSGH